jgi:hypothetical protein
MDFHAEVLGRHLIDGLLDEDGAMDTWTRWRIPEIFFRSTVTTAGEGRGAPPGAACSFIPDQLLQLVAVSHNCDMPLRSTSLTCCCQVSSVSSSM